jgi:Tfp pilus assembly protein PilF
MSETPAAQDLAGDPNERKVVERNDRIALNTPTGPATPQLHIAMAQLAERQGNIAQARHQLQHAVSVWPQDVETLRAAARMEDRQGQLPLAENLYRRAVNANPQHAGALNDLGLCLARQGKLEQSVQAIEQAIHLQPDKALYRNNAATVLVEMRQDQKALAHLSAVHGPAASNYNLGKLLVDRGRPHEAIVFFQTAVELDPTMQPAHAAIAQLNGQPAAPTQVAVENASMPQPASTPAYGPQFSPQQPIAEPTFPATARGPEFGTSTYMPPAGYYPPTNGVAATAPVYQTATAPRYLPPVRPMVPRATTVR